MFDAFTFGALVAILSLVSLASVDARRIISGRQQLATIRMRHTH